MQLLFLMLVLTSAFAADLQCYDCDPSDEGRCITPLKDNIKMVLCPEVSSNLSGLKKQINDVDKLDIEPRINLGETEYECFSLFFQTDSEDQSGVYRGCIDKPKDLKSSCEYLKERLNDGNVTTCETCFDTSCNTHYVGAANILTTSLGIIVVNLLICLNIFHF